MFNNHDNINHIESAPIETSQYSDYDYKSIMDSLEAADISTLPAEHREKFDLATRLCKSMYSLNSRLLVNRNELNSKLAYLVERESEMTHQLKMKESLLQQLYREHSHGVDDNDIDKIMIGKVDAHMFNPRKMSNFKGGNFFSDGDSDEDEFYDRHSYAAQSDMVLNGLTSFERKMKSKCKKLQIENRDMINKIVNISDQMEEFYLQEQKLIDKIVELFNNIRDRLTDLNSSLSKKLFHQTMHLSNNSTNVLNEKDKYLYDKLINSLHLQENLKDQINTLNETVHSYAYNKGAITNHSNTNTNTNTNNEAADTPEEHSLETASNNSNNASISVGLSNRNKRQQYKNFLNAKTSPSVNVKMIKNSTNSQIIDKWKKSSTQSHLGITGISSTLNQNLFENDEAYNTNSIRLKMLRRKTIDRNESQKEPSPQHDEQQNEQQNEEIEEIEKVERAQTLNPGKNTFSLADGSPGLMAKYRSVINKKN